jgi:signal transduction histidine kinase
MVGGEGLPEKRSGAERSAAVLSELAEQVSSLQEANSALTAQLHAARGKVESAHRALSLLSHPALSASMAGDYGAYFQSVAQAIVGTVCDGCTIDLVTHEGLRPFAEAHARPSRELELRDMHQRDKPSVLDEACLRVPLTMQDVSLGMMTVWSEHGRPLAPSELTLLHWVGRHLSILLDKSRLEAAAEHASKASDALLSMVSHELRTPLATISMGVDASVHRIEASADELPKSWLLQRLAKMKKAVLRTDRLVHTFLGVSQIQTGRLVPDLQEVDVAALATNVVHMMADDLSWAGCECGLHAPHPERGHWDPIQLEIVLTNLLTNAIKYAPGAPVAVRVEGEADEVVLSVEDHGPGVPTALRPRLFQRFSRLPTASRVNGFGLGLWIVKHFVEANGGQVELTSEVGRGTRFSVRLPRSGPSVTPRHSS